MFFCENQSAFIAERETQITGVAICVQKRASAVGQKRVSSFFAYTVLKYVSDQSDHKRTGQKCKNLEKKDFIIDKNDYVGL